MVCADCGNENATMNRACAYCGTRFLESALTTTWRIPAPSARQRRRLLRMWLLAGLCMALIYLLVLII